MRYVLRLICVHTLAKMNCQIFRRYWFYLHKTFLLLNSDAARRRECPWGQFEYLL